MASFKVLAPIETTGTTGAAQASRYAGATASGAPATGTFAKGDFIVSRDGNIYVCTTAGTPGTWVPLGGSGGPPSGAAGGFLSGTYPNPDAAAASAGNGLALAANVYSVNVDGTTIEINADTLRLKDTGVSAGSYGDSANVPQLTVNAKGQLSAVANVSITGSGTIAGADGWVDDSAETWTYASGSGGGTATFTVSGDLTAKYSKGTRVKLTQTTVKYFLVLGSAHAGGTTTVTISAGADYTLANAAISANYHSYVANPQGFPGWFTYTPTVTGFASLTDAFARFMAVGNTMTVAWYVKGTSNVSAASFNLSLPVAVVAFSTQSLIFASGYTVNSGTILAASVVYLDNASANARIFRDITTGLSFTNSGDKRTMATVVYQF